MSNYWSDQGSLVNLMIGLGSDGWTIYGHRKDNSDAMTDYFDPASWSGVAIKNGFTLVVGKDEDGVYQDKPKIQIFDTKMTNKIEKLQRLADDKSSTEGERRNAVDRIKKIELKMKPTLVHSNRVEYMANPKNSSWHIEKDGVLIANGVGVYRFDYADVEFDGEELILTFDTESRRAVLNKMLKLMSRFNKYVSTRISTKKESHND